jgi:hypothetical protein
MAAHEVEGVELSERTDSAVDDYEADQKHPPQETVTQLEPTPGNIPIDSARTGHPQRKKNTPYSFPDVGQGKLIAAKRDTVI